MFVINRQYVIVVSTLSHNHLLLLNGVTDSDRAMRPKVIQEVHIADVGSVIFCLSAPACRLLLQSPLHGEAARCNQVERRLAGKVTV